MNVTPIALGFAVATQLCYGDIQESAWFDVCIYLACLWASAEIKLEFLTE